MRQTCIFLSLAALGALAACSSADETFTPDYDLQVKADTTVSLTVSDATTYQTMEGFGSSDAWNMDYVGRYWSTAAKEGIARLLFSQQINGNQPEGIGLSMWRMNLGGGSAGQGDASGINDKPERRAECFLNEDGTYNWNRAAGQQYFMGKAREYGVGSFVLFSNTPPVWYTRNGKGYSDNGAYANLKDDRYDDFAAFLATCARHFSDKDYPITRVSPVNEPQYNWNGGQEGSGWQNGEVARLVKALDRELTTQGLSDTKILTGEAAAWNYLYETDTDAGAGRSGVMDYFFNPSSEGYIGNLSHVPPLICAHSYWLDTSHRELQETRRKAAAAAARYGVQLAQSEWCLMSERYEGLAGYGNASYMDLALAMAGVMHYDLTVAGVTSWAWWTSCERERWDQKSRFYLIRLIPAGGDYGALDAGGTFEASKNLWVLGNYSLFVRPGYRRISVNGPAGDGTLLTSAWISDKGDKLVLVCTNLKNKSVKLDTSVSIAGHTAKNPRQYVTSAARDLREVGSEETGIVEKRAVATIVYDLE